MNRTLAHVGMLLLGATAAVAEAIPPDAQMNQALLVEVRQLRQDLYATATTVQRVQIAIYRHQNQTAALDRATQRAQQARNVCESARRQHQSVQSQVEEAETRRRDVQDPTQKSAAEEALVQTKLFAEQWASQERDCQGEQAEAEAQFRLEQAKMSELQDQLDKLDRFLARSEGK
jgi:hypothetical protein